MDFNQSGLGGSSDQNTRSTDEMLRYYDSEKEDGLHRTYLELGPRYRGDRSDLPLTILITSSRGDRWVCLHGCSMFTRRSDLERHIRTLHSPKPLYLDCPRRRCSRKGDQGFTRLDHLNKHLRNYHMDTSKIKAPPRVHSEFGVQSPTGPGVNAHYGAKSPQEKSFQPQRSPDFDEDILKGEAVHPPEYPDWPSARSSGTLTTRRPKPAEVVHQAFIQYAKYTNELLLANGINPHRLSATHFNSFQQLPPELQRKTIETYAQNLREHQRSNTITSYAKPATVEYAAADNDDDGGAFGMLRIASPPRVANFQMQIMLLEQQNAKRRFMMTHQQDPLAPTTTWEPPAAVDPPRLSSPSLPPPQPSGSRKRKATGEDVEPA